MQTTTGGLHVVFELSAVHGLVDMTVALKTSPKTEFVIVIKRRETPKTVEHVTAYPYAAGPVPV